MKLVIYPTVYNFVQQFDDDDKAAVALHTLLRKSFPKHFGHNEPTIIQYLKRNTKYSQHPQHPHHPHHPPKKYRFENDDITSFIAYDKDSIVGFAQTVLEQPDTHGLRKLRIINLCRIRTKNYKGLGAALISNIVQYHEQQGYKIVYLTVTARNSALQQYYKSLGWICTGMYDPIAIEPAFEYYRKIDT